MFGKDKQDEQPVAVEEFHDGKGKPTPKRKEQEAARKRAFIVDPKADKKVRQAQVRERRAKEQQALLTGDERHMPAEHRGPDRKLIREFIDARTGLGEFLMPVAIVFVLVSLLFNSNPQASGWIVLVFYVLVLVTVGETIFAQRSLKRLLVTKLGASGLRRGWRFYATARMLNIRRLRVPRPVTKRGDFPV